MNLTSKVISKDFEIIEINVSQSYSIIIEVFRVQKGFKGFARSTHQSHEDIVGTAFHKVKRDCASLSIKDLKRLLAITQ